MVNVVTKTCAQEGCRRTPAFGHTRDDQALFCKAHKEPSMVNVVDRRCEVVDCRKTASHGFLSDKVCVCAGLISKLFNALMTYMAYFVYTPQIPRYCARHSIDRDGAVLLYTPYCIAEGCLKKPSFGCADDRQALYCAEHVREHPEMELVNLIAKTCEVTSCSTQPVYGFSADNSVRRCKAHILPGMINVSHRYCESCKQRIRKGGYKFDNDKVTPVHTHDVVLTCATMSVLLALIRLCYVCALCGCMQRVRWCDKCKPEGSKPRRLHRNMSPALKLQLLEHKAAKQLAQ
eukprot:4272-Heterococcus_DN1.PRE.3